VPSTTLDTLCVDDFDDTACLIASAARPWSPTFDSLTILAISTALISESGLMKLASSDSLVPTLICLLAACFCLSAIASQAFFTDVVIVSIPSIAARYFKSEVTAV